ncbi:MAG: Flp pilus assembly protein CpaB [Chloroflexota bacterium]
MKRSNRLVLLIGIFLAVVAFVLILVTLQGGGTGPGPDTPPTTAKFVIAKVDIPLGAKIQEDQLGYKEVPIADKLVNSFADTSFVVGQTARQSVTAGQAITTDILTGSSGSIADIEVPAGKVAMALQVDQVSGVGTITKAGDHVDLLIALTGDKFPVVTLNPDDDTITVVSGLNSTSVKLLLQGMQVLGTLLPPPPAQTGDNTGGATGDAETSLTGQQQIVILALDAQQSEVVKYAQVEGNISIVLRSADDFRDPATGLPLDPTLIVPATTTGITLKSIVDDYGVLIPQLVEAILPAQPANP